MENNISFERVCLCDRCIDAVWSRGEKIIKLESLFYSDDYEPGAVLPCDFCEEEFEYDSLFECVFP